MLILDDRGDNDSSKQATRSCWGERMAQLPFADFSMFTSKRCNIFVFRLPATR